MHESNPPRKSFLQSLHAKDELRKNSPSILYHWRLEQIGQENKYSLLYRWKIWRTFSVSSVYSPNSYALIFKYILAYSNNKRKTQHKKLVFFVIFHVDAKTYSDVFCFSEVYPCRAFYQNSSN